MDRRWVCLALLVLVPAVTSVCTTGQFDSNGSCQNCAAGTYTNSTTATSCQTCPTGTYSLAAASECVDCATGYSQLDFSTGNTNAASCLTGCVAGYAFSNNACTLCAAGFYSSNITAAATTTAGCQACSTGYTTSGITASSGCTLCAAGFGGSNCATCTTGLSSANLNSPSADACTLCGTDVGCSSQGTCGATGACTCSSFWQSPTAVHNTINQCSVDPCSSITCQNNGVCVRDGANAYCSCTAEYSGATCATAYDDCSLGLCGTGGTCTDGTRSSAGVYAYTCTCNAGFKVDTSTANQPTCTATPPCDSVTCVNPPLCTNYNGAAKCGIQSATDPSIFSCSTGWQGALCDTAVDFCSPNPCDSTGSSACTSSSTGYTCTCNTGYRGTTCAQPPQTIAAITVPVELAMATLTQTQYDNLGSLQARVLADTNTQYASDATYVAGSFKSYTQSFTLGTGISISFEISFVVTTANKRRRRRSISSSSQSSINSGLSSLASSIASSVSTSSGVTASVSNDVTANTASATTATDVDACVANPCLNFGTCTDKTGTDNTVAGRTCACVTGYSGVSCGTNIDDCAANPCSNGFTCTDAVNDYHCDCSASSLWSGKNCNTDLFCAASTPCSGQGTCSSASCTCNSGLSDSAGTYNYAGSRCTFKTYCITANPCPNNSQCQDSQSGRTCSCNLGYSPAWASNGNDNVQCQTYGCTGYCQNGATCAINSSGLPTCTCAAGYSGTTCTTSVCDSTNCANGGSCSVNSSGNAVCTCTAAWTGTTCTDVNHCNGNGCVNGACQILSGGYRCDCQTGWIGNLCDMPITTTTAAPITSTTPVQTTTTASSFKTEISMLLVLVISFLAF